jgi:hypothetical protein
VIYLHRLYAVLSDDGRHPDNVALLLAAALIIGAGAAGWLD